jgi:hypothetical protein
MFSSNLRTASQISLLSLKSRDTPTVYGRLKAYASLLGWYVACRPSPWQRRDSVTHKLKVTLKYKLIFKHLPLSLRVHLHYLHLLKSIAFKNWSRVKGSWLSTWAKLFLTFCMLFMPTTHEMLHLGGKDLMSCRWRATGSIISLLKDGISMSFTRPSRSGFEAITFI